MANRQKSHFGTDGYRDLELRDEALKHSNGKTMSGKLREKKQKEALKLRKERRNLKKER